MSVLLAPSRLQAFVASLLLSAAASSVALDTATIDVRVLDHFIVGKGSPFSFAEAGLL